MVMEAKKLTMPNDVTMTQDEWDAFCDRKMALSGYVCLAIMPGDEWYTGLVEKSFSLDTSPKATQFFWSGKGTDNIFGKVHEVNGWKNAQYRADYYKNLHPGMEVLIFDVHDDLLPVVLDWDKWVYDSRPANTFSGVANKYGSRNIGFELDTSKPMII